MTVKRPTLVGATVDELIQFIETRQLAAGDTLPSTADLAEQLDVSRTVVREAIAELAGQGLLTRRQGKDTTISFPGSKEFERLLRLRKALGSPAEPALTQWRSVLLTSAAGLAAREATLDDATDLESQVAVLKDAVTAGDVVSAEEGIYASLAEISGNDMMKLSIEGSAALVRPGRVALWTELRRDKGRVASIHEALDGVRNAIQMRDPEGATHAMTRYLVAASATSGEPFALNR